MNDRAPEVAEFLTERGAADVEADVLWAEMRHLWPGLTREEGARGALIAAEILAGTLAENETTCAAVEAEMVERRIIAAATADLGETEFRDLAEATGIPLNAVREAMQALQRGDPLPPLDDEPQEVAP